MGAMRTIDSILSAKEAEEIWETFIDKPKAFLDPQIFFHNTVLCHPSELNRIDPNLSGIIAIMQFKGKLIEYLYWGSGNVREQLARGLSLPCISGNYIVYELEVGIIENQPDPEKFLKRMKHYFPPKCK